ncbi:LysR family regulatory protein [Aspergillus fijiensis CBS 313.89]|uniref:LysR family regulatory protein n=1 Tax=Aspergillus fijiensis CBS 313.89 TaxID=1448319 RepID=A0A8G1RT53_9EURO|nr:LysR family regulatory protein [Aspergillus fijiensis CBS 313.89]RAK77051.1 LysR family regulatory protein [Aspergillus fijiensis CBS 313.89]
MGLLSILFGHRQVPTFPTDRIIPLRVWDDIPHLRSLVHDCTFGFDDVLDITKLREALHTLLHIGNWRQLGARLRLNSEGKLEYHIPTQYDDTRSAFIFTTTKHTSSINDHPLGSRLPRTSSSKAPFLAPCAAEFIPLVCGHGSPQVLRDWISSDLPQLRIHVVLFDDSTLLTITHPHTLMDAVGRSTFLRAWTAVLRGQLGEVPPFRDLSEDPLASLGVEVPGPSYIHADRVLQGLGIVGFGIRHLFDMWFHRQQDHLFLIPGRLVDRMRQEVLQETPSSDGTAFSYLSESDVLLSWWLKSVTRALDLSPDQTIMSMNMFEIRDLFRDWFPTGSAYIGNAIFPCYTLCSVPEIMGGSLGTLAQANRRALSRHRTKEQVHALAALQSRSLLKTIPLVGESNLVFMACTNHHKARFFELDFSAAVVRPGVPLSKRANQLGRPSYIGYAEHTDGYYSTRNLLRVIGKDAVGNWWLSCTLREGAWEKIVGLLNSALMEIDKTLET